MEVKELTDEDLYGDCLPQASDKQLGSISELIKTSTHLEEGIEDLTAQMKSLVEQKRKIDEVSLPEAMHAAGTLKFTDDNGTTVSLENKVYGSLSEERKPGAFAWMRENGHGPLITNAFTIPLKKGMDAIAEKIREFLVGAEVEFDIKENVHTATLQAFVKEQVREAKPLPLDLFGVHIRTVAVIKVKKPKKTA